MVKPLPKKDPNVNPVELLVNRRMSSFVQSNRCYYSRDELRDAGSEFLRSYNAVYAAGQSAAPLSLPSLFLHHPSISVVGSLCNDA